MFLITLLAVGAAVAAWLRPIPHSTSATPSAPTYSEQQVSDAKAKVCAIELSKNKGSCALSSTQLSPGTYSLVANYGGTKNLGASTATIGGLTVAQATTTTVVTLSSATVTSGDE